MLQLLLEGSWVVISGLIGPLIWVVIMVALLVAPLITTHEPPSRLLESLGVYLTSVPG